MSKRLTSDWTDNAEQAFGDAGTIGDRGELEVVAYLRKLLPDATIEHHPSNYTLQTNGIDITINGNIGVDVKTNLHKGKDVIVEKPKLMKSKAALWIHWNIHDKTDPPVMYRVKDMQQLIANRTTWGEDELVFVKRSEVPDI